MRCTDAGRKSDDKPLPIAYPPDERDIAMPDDLLTENEAASITGVPLRQIDRMIEAGWLDGLVEEHGSVRLVPRSVLVGLRLAHATAGVLTDEARRAVVAAMVRQPIAPRIQTSEAVSVDTTSATEAVRMGLDVLTQARSLVETDPDLMGGAPVFAGTRIPVRQIATMRQNGDSVATLLGAFPALDARMIDLAIVYAAAYPPDPLPPETSPAGKIKLKSRQVVLLDDLR